MSIPVSKQSADPCWLAVREDEDLARYQAPKRRQKKEWQE